MGHAESEKNKKHNENTLESLNKEDVWSFGIKHGDWIKTKSFSHSLLIAFFRGKVNQELVASTNEEADSLKTDQSQA